MQDASSVAGTGKRFQPGQSGNPLGSSKIIKEMQVVRKLTQTQFTQLVTDLLDKPISEVDKISRNPETKALTALAASILTVGVQEGDPVRLNFFVERLLGKVPNKLEVNTSALTDEELEYKLQEAITFIKSEKSDDTNNSETGSNPS